MFLCSQDEQGQGRKVGEERRGTEKRAERQADEVCMRRCLGAQGGVWGQKEIFTRKTNQQASISSRPCLLYPTSTLGLTL